MNGNLRCRVNSDRRSAYTIGVSFFTVEENEQIQLELHPIRFSLRKYRCPNGIGPISFRPNYFLTAVETEASCKFDSKYATTIRPFQNSESINRVVWLHNAINYAEKVSSPFKKRVSVDAFKENLFSNSDFVSHESGLNIKNEASYNNCVAKILYSRIGTASAPGRRLCRSIISRLPLKSNTSKLFCNNGISNLAIHFISNPFFKVRSNFNRNQI
ncbi:MAG: hypothetical protein B7Y39_07635 [Bdellovibrio sp. 28-41-41]|nr:MAG: hypothetical protein B7Y39_07635 [Bdellovibrio sp. 28-41-41]